MRKGECENTDALEVYERGEAKLENVQECDGEKDDRQNAEQAAYEAQLNDNGNLVEALSIDGMRYPPEVLRMKGIELHFAKKAYEAYYIEKMRQCVIDDDYLELGRMMCTNAKAYLKELSE